MPVLVLADHDLGHLSPATSRAVSAALHLGDEIHVLVAGAGIGNIAEDAAGLAGVTRVLSADDGIFADMPTEPLVALLDALGDDYSHILGIAAAMGREVMPRLAAIRDIQPVTDITAILGPDRFARPIYAGNAVETVTSPQKRQILTIRASAFAPVANEGAAEIVPVAVPALQGLVRFIASHRTQSDAPDLATSSIVVAGGVGLGSRQGFAMVEDLAESLGGAVGATRAAVDADYAPNDWQIGQTGKIVAPDLYIGIGISGALQHLAGMQGAKTIIAINKDPDAPLMKLADFAYQGDLFDTVPALIAALKAR